MLFSFVVVIFCLFFVPGPLLDPPWPSPVCEHLGCHWAPLPFAPRRPGACVGPCASQYARLLGLLIPWRPASPALLWAGR